MTGAQSTQTYARQIQFAFSSTNWGFPLLIVSLVVILVLVHQKSWRRFSERKKWSSRFILFILTIALAVPLYLAQLWTQSIIPGKIKFASPDLTSAAIKLGAYGLVWGHELESRLSPEKQELAKCVETLSRAEARKYQNTCGDNRACFEHIPPMTKEAIVSKIRESQTKTIPDVSSACKTVDVAKL